MKCFWVRKCLLIQLFLNNRFAKLWIMNLRFRLSDDSLFKISFFDHKCIFFGNYYSNSCFIMVWLMCRSFQVGKEKFLVPWLFLINRKSSEVPMIDMHLVRYLCSFTPLLLDINIPRKTCFLENVSGYFAWFDLLLVVFNFFVIQRYSGGDLHGVTAKIVDMPHHCM